MVHKNIYVNYCNSVNRLLVKSFLRELNVKCFYIVHKIIFMQIDIEFNAAIYIRTIQIFCCTQINSAHVSFLKSIARQMIFSTQTLQSNTD